MRFFHRNSLMFPRIGMIGIARWGLIVLPICGLVWIVGPAFVTIVYGSFRGPAELLPFETGGRFTLANIEDVYASGILTATAMDTLVYSLGSAILACIVALFLAWLVSQPRTPFRKILIVSIVAPAIIPPIVTSIAWVQLLSPSQGLFNVLIRTCLFLPIDRGPIDVFSMYGMILVQGFGLVPILFLMIYASVRSMDHSMEEASYAAGAGTVTTLWRVTLPMLRPSILAAFLVALIFSMESFEVPILLGLSSGVQVLGSYVYNGLYPVGGGLPQYGQVSVVGLHFLVVSYLIFLAYMWATRHSDRFGMVAGTKATESVVKTGARGYLTLIPVLIYLMTATIAPVFLMLWLSLSQGYALPSVETVSQITLDNYWAVASGGQLPGAILNTLFVAVGAASLTTIVSAVIAWTVVRKQLPRVIAQAIDLLASSSIVIPTAIAAMGFAVFYMALPGPLYGTLFVLILAYSYRTTLAFRINRAGIAQINEEMEAASYVVGGSWAQTFRRITVPLLRRSLLSSWIILAIVAVREFTIPLVMTAGGEPTVAGVLIWQLQQTSLGESMAAGVLTILVTSVIGLVAYLVLNRRRDLGV